MDVNGSEFHTLTGSEDWARVLPDGSALSWDEERQSVAFQALPSRLSRRAAEPILTPEFRRGAGRDRFGHFYWIDESNTAIRFLPAGSTVAGTAWSIDDLDQQCPPHGDADFVPAEASQPVHRPTLRGLAVTTHHYLVVGTLDPAGLLIFDLHAGGPPQWMLWPEAISFAPYDMAAASDGGVWILDRGPARGSSRFWRLDRNFQVIPAAHVTLHESTVDDFQPAESAEVSPPETPRGTPATMFPVGIELGMASPAEVLDPVAIEALPDGSVLILETAPAATYSLVHRYRDGAKVATVSLENILGELFSGDQFSTDSSIRAHDFAFHNSAAASTEAIAGELVVVGDDGNQAFPLKFIDRGEAQSPPGFHLEPQVRLLPLRRFGGKALVGTEDGVFYDFDDRWLRITEQPRRRYPDEETVAGIVFDGRRPDTTWHRVLLDACLPNGCRIEVASRAANRPELLGIAPWYVEPQPVLRKSGAELPFYQPFSECERRDDGTGTYDVLLQQAQGRYLELRLSFFSNQRSTPRLRALRVYYPRFSYLREYLPSIYSADPESADFLDRYLSNAEGLLTALEGEVADAQMLLDIRTASPEFLDWLAGWVGAVLDPAWDLFRRRLFLSHAMLLYRWRGTVGGLRAAVRMAIDPCPDERIFDELRAAGGSEFVTAAGSRYSAGMPSAACGDSTELAQIARGAWSVRIVEHFLKRAFPGVALGDPTRFDDSAPRSEPSTTAADPCDQSSNETSADWIPAHGANALHQRYQAFLSARYNDSIDALNSAWDLVSTVAGFHEIALPPIEPDHPVRAADWRAFISGPIGFTYAVVRASTGEDGTTALSDTQRFREFLQRRYQVATRLNSAWQLSAADQYASFTDVALPGLSEFPQAGQRLADWIEFVSTVLPIGRNAHRFTVLIPMSPGEARSETFMRLARAEEVVRRERPLHTDFQVQPYWALFQVGGARLGLDTAVGEGSRFVSVVLGATAFSEGALQGGHPWDVNDRRIVGRDSIWTRPRGAQERRS